MPAPARVPTAVRLRWRRPGASGLVDRRGRSTWWCAPGRRVGGDAGPGSPARDRACSGQRERQQAWRSRDPARRAPPHRSARRPRRTRRRSPTGSPWPGEQQRCRAQSVLGRASSVMVMVEVRGRGSPGAEVGQQHDRDHRSAGDRGRQRDRAPGATARRDRARALRVRRSAGGSSTRWPSTCGAIATSQTMKLTLCHSSSWSREPGPSTSSSTPVTNTASVVTTSTGARPRSSGCGGPFRRYARGREVVAGEAISGAGQLERDRADQQQPEEQMQPQKLPDADDRDAEHREQHQQQHADDRGQPLVAVGAATEEGPPATCGHGLRSALDHRHARSVGTAA